MKNFSDIEQTDSLISSYLSGNCTLAEAEELIHWIKSSEENLKYFAQYKMFWLQARQWDDKLIMDKWEHLQILIDERENVARETIVMPLKSRKQILKVFRYAAVFIALVALSVFSYFWQTNSRPEVALKQNIIKVPYGSKLSLTLPDKTQIWINSGSKVIYDNRFGIDHRNIRIIGEVYFDVAKNPQLPFIVQAGDVRIRAIGTAFNVKAYPEENRIETTLVHGSVEINQKGENKQILLSPSEKVVIVNKVESENHVHTAAEENKKAEENEIVEVQEQVTINKEINTEKEIGWKDGKLIFESEPLETLTIQLKRKYDVTFEFYDKKLLNYKFSGTFQDMTLEKIMEALRFSSPINYEIDGKKVIIKEKLQ